MENTNPAKDAKTESLIQNESPNISDEPSELKDYVFVNKLAPLKPWIKFVYGTGDFSCKSRIVLFFKRRKY